MMRRETTNAIRYVLEELIPPVFRDSRAMRWLFRLHWGQLIDDLERFRERIPFVTPEEYKDVYERHPRVQDETDNSAACIERLAATLVGRTVLDVGCGTGFLLQNLSEIMPDRDWTGVDFIVEEGTRRRPAGLKFRQANIEALPFADAAFDTVICTHVLEHILDLRRAIAELRRVTAQRLILIVPREREYRFTFNPHLHFFPYKHSFLRYLVPIPARYGIEDIGRDIFYFEDVAS
jgi:SAM-dependent methyltransferase